MSLVLRKEIISILERLVERSVVHFDPSSGRYELLDSVAAYATERAEEEEESESLRDRHRVYAIDLVEEACRHHFGRDEARWFEVISGEMENIRCAWSWCFASPRSRDGNGGSCAEGEFALRLTSALLRYWDYSMTFRQASQWCQATLAHPGAQEPTLLRATVLGGSGSMQYRLGNLFPATRYHQEALEIRRRHGDQRAIGFSLTNLGTIACQIGDVSQGLNFLQEGLRLCEESGDISSAAAILSNIGSIRIAAGDFEGARDALMRADLLCLKMDSQPRRVNVQANLVELAIAMEDADAACHHCALALRMCADHGEGLDAADLLVYAGLLGARHDPTVAVKLLGAARAIADNADAPLDDEIEAFAERALSEVAQRLGEGASKSGLRHGRSLSKSEAVGLGGKLMQAAVLAGQAQSSVARH